MLQEPLATTWKSQLPLWIRAIYSAVFLVAAIWLVLDRSVSSVIWGILLLLLAAVSLFYSTFVKVDGEILTAGVMGVSLVKWRLSDISSVAEFSLDELPLPYKWVFGIYIRDVKSLFFASGREAISLRNSATKWHIMVSVKGCGELLQRLRNEPVATAAEGR